MSLIYHILRGIFNKSDLIFAYILILTQYSPTPAAASMDWLLFYIFVLILYSFASLCMKKTMSLLPLAVIRFLCAQGSSAAEIHWELCVAYESPVMTEENVRKWCRFRNWQTNVYDIHQRWIKTYKNITYQNLYQLFIIQPTFWLSSHGSQQLLQPYQIDFQTAHHNYI